MTIDIHPLIGVLSGVWLLTFLVARAQTEKVKKRTTELVLEMASTAAQGEVLPTVEQFYEEFQPRWESMLRETAFMILHKSELFPIPARPDLVRQRLNFSPAWVGAFLRMHGYPWRAAPALDAEVKSILSMVPPKRSRR